MCVQFTSRQPVRRSVNALEDAVPLKDLQGSIMHRPSKQALFDRHRHSVLSLSLSSATQKAARFKKDPILPLNGRKVLSVPASVHSTHHQRRRHHNTPLKTETLHPQAVRAMLLVWCKGFLRSIDTIGHITRTRPTAAAAATPCMS